MSCSDSTNDSFVADHQATLLSTVELIPIADAYIRNGSPNQNEGAEDILRVRKSGKNRVLLQFDQAELLTAVGNEPVASAHLELTIVTNGGQWGSSGRSVGVHRMTAPWTEAGATWHCGDDTDSANSTDDCPTTGWDMDDSSAWPFSFAPTSTSLATNESAGVFILDVTADVQAFVDGSTQNLGWLVRLINENEAGHFDFGSRESTAPPKLVITVGIPDEPEPPQCAVTALQGDTYLRKGSPNQNEGGLGLLRIKSSGQNRALVQVDAQALVDATAGKTLQSAELRFTVGHNGGNWGQGGELDLHRLLVPWEELSATWNCATDSDIGNSQSDCSVETAWDMDGDETSAPYAWTPTDTVFVTNDTTDTISFDISVDVQAILAGEPSYGWIVRKRDEGQSGLVELVSREASTSTAGVVLTCLEDGTPTELCDNEVDDDGDGAVDCADTDCQVGVDGTCDGVDDDCDGLTDDDYVVTATSCGLGACSGNAGMLSCASGIEVDSCDPLEGATPDTQCDGIDNDCDGEVDEGYVGQPTACGVGACAATGVLSCVGGSEQDSCVPGTPAPDDALCNAVDDDCDALIDEDFVFVATSCGIGACAARGTTSCLGGAVVDSCTPGVPAEDDASCDGIDNDCDGEIDEDCCLPATCQDYNVNCGAVPDGCGGTLQCGTCQGAEACGGAGVPNVCGIPLPPDPAEVAPQTAVGTGRFLSTYEFLVEGDTPVQSNVAPGALQSHRAAIVRGRVLGVSGEPLPGVRVHVPQAPELGETASRIDGQYDLMVNGGGLVTLQFEAAGYLPIQRTLSVPWEGFSNVDDVVMTAASDVATLITFGSTEPQVAQSRAVTDQDGTRKITAYFPSGTQAVAELNGQSVPLQSGTLRMTEYTVGESGPQAMPAALPENSFYTFAADLSLDEVGPLNDVEFSQTVYFYLDNFLGFPVGAQVPNGHYDYDSAQWIAELDGRVMKLVGVSPDGLAEIDAIYDEPEDGVAQDAATLALLGMTDEERRVIAERFAPGTVFWRMPLEHMSPVDWNANGILITPPPPEPPPPAWAVRTDCDDTSSGSIIYCQSRKLAEEIELPGTPYVLRYDSDRARTNVAVDRTATIAFPTEPPPATATSFQLTVSVLGRVLVDETLPLDTESHTVIWDGEDAFGRSWRGPAELEYVLQYNHIAEYGLALRREITAAEASRSLGGAVCGVGDPCCVAPGGFAALPVRGGLQTSRMAQTRRRLTRKIPLGPAGVLPFGGWSLTDYHAYDPQSQTLMRGDGTNRRLGGLLGTATGVVAGRASNGVLGDELNDWQAYPAIYNDISKPEEIAVAADGSVYFVSQQSIWKMEPTGDTWPFLRSDETINAAGEYCRDVADLTVAPDGGLYAICRGSSGGGSVVRFERSAAGPMAAEYITAKRHGGDEPLIWQDGEPLADGWVWPMSIAFRQDGTLFIVGLQPDAFSPNSLPLGSQYGNHGRSVREYELIELRSNGRGRVVEPAFTGDSGQPEVLAVGPKIAAAGRNTVVNFTGPSGYYSQDGDKEGRLVQIFPNDTASVLMKSFQPNGTPIGAVAGFDWESTETHRAYYPYAFRDIAASTGTGDIFLVFSECANAQLFQITSAGRIRRVSMEGLPRDIHPSILSAPCAESNLNTSGGGGLPYGAAATPSGQVYVSDWFLSRLYLLGDSGNRQDGAFEVVSRDGEEIYHFSEAGLHVWTEDAKTGAELLRFTHDSEGALIAAADRNGRTTSFDRSQPSAITVTAPAGPGETQGVVTELLVNEHQHLVELRDPRGGVWAFDYEDPVMAEQGWGLLARLWDPRANAEGVRQGTPYEFEYERFRVDQSSSPVPEARWLLKSDADPVAASATPATSQSLTSSHSRALQPILGTWCDGSQYVRGYRNVSSTTTVTKRSNAGRQTQFDTTIRNEFPYLLSRQARSGRNVTAARRDPSGWLVTRGDIDSELRGSASWPGGSLSYTRQAHERLGIATLAPESAELSFEATTGAYPRPGLGQSTDAELSTNFSPAPGFSLPDDETVTSTVAAQDGTERVSVSHYDGTTRATTTTSPEGRTSTYVLDEHSRLVSLELPGQVPVVYNYDADGYLRSIERSSGARIRRTELDYDGYGYVSSVTNRVDASVTDEVTMSNDPMGFATETSVPGLLSVGSAPDIAGALASLTPDGKPEHQLSHTPLGQLSQYAPPGATLSPPGTCAPGTQCWHYSLDRELDAITLPDGEAVDYVYGAQTGLLDQVTVPDHGSTSFGYDSVGRRIAATGPTGGKMEFAWQSKLPIATRWYGTHTLTDQGAPVWSGTLDGTVERFYNDFIEVSRLKVSDSAGDSALDVNLLRDDDGLLTQVTDASGAATPLPSFALDRSPIDGHVQGTSVGQLSTTRGLDVDLDNPGFGDLLGSSAAYGATSLYRSSYTHDDRGRIDTWTEEVLGEAPRTRKFLYDGAGRLIEVQDADSGALLEQYAYDGNGNRTRALSTGLNVELGTNIGCPDASGTAANDQDQLCRHGDFDYRYNARGQLEERERVSGGALTQYRYDGLGRLKKVTIESGAEIHYVHDALGRRIGKVIDAQLDKGWLYADALNPIAQLDSNGDIEASFVYGTRGHVPDLMVLTDGTTYRLIADHLGSVRLVVDVHTGAVAQRIDYDSFGRVLTDTNPGFQPFGFAGGLYDGDTGLVRFGARDYDAYAGRWTAKDPILFGSDSANFYSYVGSDPINYVDPSGTLRWPWDIKGDAADDAFEDVPGGGHNDPTDAYRHCLASCDATLEYGSTAAEFLGDLNEVQGDLLDGQPGNERRMDQLNNACGRKAGNDIRGEGGSREDCRSACKSLLQSGHLQTSPGTPGPYRY